jgi:tellurite methyltransferase
MQRPIIGFVQDSDGGEQALLGCGHLQSISYTPPVQHQPSPGDNIDCERCDRFELPEHFIAYKRTPEFTEETVPAGLTNNHSTKSGVWAKIHVLSGRLRYRVPTLNADQELTPQRIGIVVPEVLHNVVPLAAVRFFVEFYKAP